MWILIQGNVFNSNKKFHFFLVNGGLTNWTPFTSCSKSCGKGSQERTRTCTNPPPQHGGDDCVGGLKESRECKIKECPGKIFQNEPSVPV